MASHLGTGVVVRVYRDVKCMNLRELHTRSLRVHVPLVWMGWTL